jgi:hypothetical protein
MRTRGHAYSWELSPPSPIQEATQVSGETVNRVSLRTLTWNTITMTVDGTPSSQALSVGKMEYPSQVRCSYAGP